MFFHNGNTKYLKIVEGFTVFSWKECVSEMNDSDIGYCDETPRRPIVIANTTELKPHWVSLYMIDGDVHILVVTSGTATTKQTHYLHVTVLLNETFSRKKSFNYLK